MHVKSLSQVLAQPGLKPRTSWSRSQVSTTRPQRHNVQLPLEEKTSGFNSQANLDFQFSTYFLPWEFLIHVITSELHDICRGPNIILYSLLGSICTFFCHAIQEVVLHKHGDISQDWAGSVGWDGQDGAGLQRPGTSTGSGAGQARAETLLGWLTPQLYWDGWPRWGKSSDPCGPKGESMFNIPCLGVSRPVCTVDVVVFLVIVVATVSCRFCWYCCFDCCCGCCCYIWNGTIFQCWTYFELEQLAYCKNCCSQFVTIISNGNKLRGRPKTTLPIVLNRDLSLIQDTIRLHSSKELA